MIRPGTLLLMLMLLMAATEARAQTGETVVDSVLAGITARGRMLAAYDVAAWHATDAVQALPGKRSPVNAFIARADSNGRWMVSFGMITEARDTFYREYEAIQGDTPEQFSVKVHSPPEAMTGYERAAAAALRLGVDTFGTMQRPYNAYVIPAPGGEWWVYLLPAQTQWGIYPHGGDVRYRVSPDGATILETHRMHNTVIDLQMPDSAVSGGHTAVVDTLPEDSDVFLVLSRAPRKPEYVVSDCCMYAVQLDGRIIRIRRDPEN
jgi:hypothetical protein